MQLDDENKGRFRILAQQLLVAQNKAELNDVVMGVGRIAVIVALRQPKVRQALERVANGDFSELEQLLQDE